MAATQLQELFTQYISGNASAQQREELFRMLLLPEHQEQAKELVRLLVLHPEPVQPIADTAVNEIVQAILQNDLTVVAAKPDTDKILSIPYSRKPARRLPLLGITWFRAAVIVLLMAGTVTLFYKINSSRKDIGEQLAVIQQEIIPGSNKATLTLGDGKIIPLDSTLNGTLAQQSGVNIIKLNNGQLAYRFPDKAQASAASTADIPVSYNTVSTPNGGMYQVILPDGTKAWLNAASAIKFPARFSSEERRVEVKGEVYFEVKANPKKPFYVTTEGISIQVLGTSFNVNAYDDETSVRTTLIDGSVRVISSAGTETLTPRQQVQLNKMSGKLERVKTVDTEEVLAWKKGYFYFENADLQTVMRQIARWYDVTVEYRGTIPPMKFGGEISRNVNAEQVLQILAQAGLHFTVEGKKIIIIP